MFLIMENTFAIIKLRSKKVKDKMDAEIHNC